MALIREFVESDSGDDFAIVNAIEYRDPPGRVEGVPPGASAEEILGHYMAYMWPALLSRACHPVLMGRAAGGALVLGLLGLLLDGIADQSSRPATSRARAL